MVEKKQIKMKLSQIKEYELNNKDHPRQQIDLLKKMITEYGYDSPIIVNKDGVVIAGHGRLKALQELGYEEVDVIVKDKLTKKQEQKYRLLDNKIAELATSQIDNIKIELEELQDEELNSLYADIDIQTDEEESREEIEDNIPEIPKAMGIIKRGDVIELGKHRLMCGDSTDKEDVDKLMDGKKADMVFTDPPYGVKINNTNGSILGDENLDVFELCLVNLVEFSKSDAQIYIYFGVQFLQESITILNSNFKQTNLLINRITHENKPSPYGYFKGNYELCYFSNPEGKSFNEGYGDVSETTLKDSRYKGNGKMKTYPALLDGIKATEHNLKAIHPTQKTISICEFYQNISSNIGNIVLDLFLGSGSTLIASEKTNRICYGMELDEHYCEVIIQRYTDYVKNPTIKINGIEQNRSDLVSKATKDGKD